MAIPNRLQELFTETERIIEASDDLLAIQMSKVQREVFREILETLRTFQDSDFRLSSQSKDSALYLRLRRRIKEIFEKSGYIPAINKYLATFDPVEDLAKQKIIIGSPDTSARAVKAVSAVVEKEMFAGEIAARLITGTQIETTFVAPLQRMVFQAVQNNQTYGQAEKVLRTFLMDNPKGAGYVKRYVTQITRDGINQFQGAVQQKMVKDLGLNAFRYVGSLLPKDSRENCVELVNGTGAFAPYAIRPREYLISSLPQIISIAEGRGGWIAGTTPETFFINRGGYNCRHEAIPFEYIA